MQLELPIAIKRDVEYVTTRTIASKHVLAICQHYGTNRDLAALEQFLARYINTLTGRIGFKGWVVRFVVVGTSNRMRHDHFFLTGVQYDFNLRLNPSA